jgi:SAM-dependent methyltransferase
MASRHASQEAVVQDLLSLERAEAYCRWLAGFFAPFRGRRIVELGSGIGNLTRYLLDGTERAWLLEVDPGLCETLRSRFERPGVEVVQVDLGAGMPEGLVRDLQADHVDTIFSSNVMEHIRDDLLLLRQAHQVLVPGGRTMHIVPAQRWLFNRLDRAYGHERRYAKDRVREVIRQGGWAPEAMQYFNLSGTLAWAVSGSARTAFRAGRVDLFERWFLPLERALARRWRRLPVGLSLFFALRKL